MSSRIITTPQEKRDFMKFVEQHAIPCSVSIVKGKDRTSLQNTLQWKWFVEVSRQAEDMSPEDVRGYCKLTIGVPILRAENEAFREIYDRLIRPLDYEDKLKLMMSPMDFSVTSIMTTKQMANYLDDVMRHWSEKGYILTDPSLQGL